MKKILILSLLVFASPLFANLTCFLTTGSSSWPYSPYIVHLKDVGDSLDLWESYGITDNFETFCIERNVNFSPNRTYTATIDDSIIYGGGYPVLQTTTKMIYAAYTNGSLSSYTGNYVQNAVWYSQHNSGNLGYYFGGDISSYDTAGYQDVMALNLWDGSRDIQSHLVRISAVPAPGAVTLGGIGLAFIGWLKRKRSM